MIRRPGQLRDYDKNRSAHMVASMRAMNERSAQLATQIPEITLPNFRKWTDGELAELIARNSKTPDARLAESELRRREAWRTPAKWSLIIAGVALLVSIIALARTFGLLAG